MMMLRRITDILAIWCAALGLIVGPALVRAACVPVNIRTCLERVGDCSIAQVERHSPVPFETFGLYDIALDGCADADARPPVGPVEDPCRCSGRKPTPCPKPAPEPKPDPDQDSKSKPRCIPVCYFLLCPTQIPILPDGHRDLKLWLNAIASLPAYINIASPTLTSVGWRTAPVRGSPSTPALARLCVWRN